VNVFHLPGVRVLSYYVKIKKMTKGIFLLDKLTEEKVKQIVNLGVDTVFIGHQNFDQKLGKKLKNNGLKIYIEVGIFVGEEWWEKYPDCRPVDKNGNLMDKIHWYAGVCPNHQGVRREKLRLIKSIIDNYHIDGIWLDFIRYPCHWEEIRSKNIAEYCFCQNCLNKFKKDEGGKSEGKKWVQWKCNQITNFVGEIHRLIDRSGKDIKLGMFSVPWRKSDFGGAITKIIGQDFKSLAKYIDVFSPMVYQKMCGRKTDWIYEIVAYMKKITRCQVLPIVQTEDKPTKLTAEEFADELKQACKFPSEGVIVFFLEDLLKNGNKLKIVKETFR